LRVGYVVQAVLLLVGAWLAWRCPRQRVAVLLGVVTLGLALGISLLVSPVFAVRYISPLGLAFGFLLARGITALPNPVLVAAAAVLAFMPVVTSLGPLYTDPGYGRADLRSAARAVQAARTADEVVLHLGAFTAAPFDYYQVAPPGLVLETNDRAELCRAMRGRTGAWLITAYLPDDPVAQQSAEAGIATPSYAEGLLEAEPLRFQGVSVFHLVGDC
jgi:hypothetical protein